MKSAIWISAEYKLDHRLDQHFDQHLICQFHVKLFEGAIVYLTLSDVIGCMPGLEPAIISLAVLQELALEMNTNGHTV